MAATESGKSTIFAALTAAAAALPLVAIPVEAGQIETTTLGLTTLNYREHDGRMTVAAPLAWVSTPLTTDVDVFARVVVDTLSGASPQSVGNQGGRVVHSLSSASIKELRREGSFRLTRWREDDQFSIAVSTSSEHDYVSRALQLEARMEMASRLFSLDLGLGQSKDTMTATGDASIHGTRQTLNAFVGITGALSATDMLQSNLAYSTGSGYFDDPYKFTVTFATPASRLPVIKPDRRPDDRQSVAWLTRWRHYVVPAAAALSVDYRYYRDSWEVRAHMLEAGWHQTLNNHWSVKPMLRWYRQTAAEFYGTGFLARTGLGSSDYRLGALRSRTVGASIVYDGTRSGRFELFGGRYAQHLTANADPAAVDPARLNADVVMLSWSTSF